MKNDGLGEIRAPWIKGQKEKSRAETRKQRAKSKERRARRGICDAEHLKHDLRSEEMCGWGSGKPPWGGPHTRENRPLKKREEESKTRNTSPVIFQ